MSHKSHSYAPNWRTDSNRIARSYNQRAILVCARARAVARVITPDLPRVFHIIGVSSVRQYFTTINYYSRIDLTPNADTQITAIGLSLCRSLSRSFPRFLCALFHPWFLSLLLPSLALHADAPVHLGRLCHGRETLFRF